MRVTADDFGAGVAEEAARFGNAALKTALGSTALKTVLGGVADGLRERRQGAEDGAFVSAAVTEGRDRLTTIFDEIEGQATDGPEDLASAFQRRAAEETEALVDDMRSRGQRPSSSGMAEAMRQLEGLQADFGVEAAVFENNARVGRLARGLDDTLAAAQARAFSHPEQLHGLLDDVERTAARLAPHIDNDTVEVFKKGAPERIATAALSGIMALDPAGARDGLAAGDFDNLLGDHMRQALGRQAAAQAEGAEARRAAQEASDREDVRRDLAGGLVNGGKGFPDIARAVTEQVIDTDEAKRLEGLLETRLEADRRVAGALAGDTPLDPGDALQARALDRYYRDIFRPRLDGLAEPDVQRALTDLFRRAGRVPDAMTRELRAGILSGDPDREAMAAGRLATLQCHHPQPLPQPHRPIAGPEPFDAIPADEQARAHAIAGFANLGMAPAHAVRLADQKLERHDIIELAPRPGMEDDIQCQDPDPGFRRPMPNTGIDSLPIAVSGRDQRPRPAAAPPGFVWENGAWRRETEQEAARRRVDGLFAGIGSAPGATGGDGQGHDGGNDGGVHLLAAEGAAGGGGGGSSGGGAPSTGPAAGPTVKAGAAKPAGGEDASGDDGDGSSADDAGDGDVEHDGDQEAGDGAGEAPDGTDGPPVRGPDDFLVPAWKEGVVTQDQMDAFMNRHGDADPNLQWTLKEVFAAEGGLARDKETGKAFAGITPGTLAGLNDRMGKVRNGEKLIPDRPLPQPQGTGKERRTPDLTPEQAANAYRANLDDVMRKYGGVQALETLPDKKTAAVIADTQFQHGSKGGAQIIEDATNDVINGLSAQEQQKLGVGELTNETGPKDTLAAIQKLSKGGHDQELRNSIADLRSQTDVAVSSKGVRDRINYFRFRRP